MVFLKRSILFAFVCGLFWLMPAHTSAAQTALSSAVLWQQSPDGNAAFGPSTRSIVPGQADQELADDFNVTGQIERLTVNGYGCFNCSPPQVAGVYVRFYEHTPGGPGALQQEYYLQANDPAFIYDPDNPEYLDITLSTPFTASGQHFVSVQLHTDGWWQWWESNKENPNISRIYIRNILAGESWHYYDFAGFGNADVGFTLYGQVTGAPQISALSGAAMDRSGRLRIFGANFGAEQANSQVLIDGAPALIGLWAGDQIHAYVPETAGPGPVDIQVVTANGSSNTLPLNVTLRQQQGRLKWRFQVDGLYSLVRPAVAPDGSIYIVGVEGNLYGLTPDGGLRFIVYGVGGKGVTVDQNGVVYAGDENSVTAVNPDGTVRWTYTFSPRAFILLGPNVGPDGNVYGVAVESIGAFSLTPEGQLRWSYPEQYQRPIVDYAEMHFGYNGSTLQMYYYANRHLRAFTADGDLVFEPGIQVGTPTVGPDNTVYNGGIVRYTPDGDVIDVYTPPPPGNTLSAPHAAANSGNIYHVQNLGTLRSLTPALDVRWEMVTGLILGQPMPDPTDRLIVTGGAANFGESGFIAGFSTQDGAEMWRVYLPPENGGNHTAGSSVRYTPDGNTSYMNTLVAGMSPDDEYWFLYAIDSSAEGNGNLPPTAGDDFYHMAAGNALYVDPLGILSNDADPNGDGLAAVLVNDVQHGILELDSNGGFVYNPAYGYSGVDSFTYRASDGALQSNLATVIINVNHDRVFMTTDQSGIGNGVVYDPEDIFFHDTVARQFAMYFDGSDVSLSGANVDAFLLLRQGKIVMSFADPTNVPGIGLVEDEDLVLFLPTSLGSNTAGTFSFIFDGSDVGLTTAEEDVDAIALVNNILTVSTSGPFAVPGLTGEDEDVIQLNNATFGSNTSGVWSLAFDGSDVGLGTNENGDVDGVWYSSVGFYLSTLGPAMPAGQGILGNDIFFCPAGTFGDVTSCGAAANRYWQGSITGMTVANISDFFILHIGTTQLSPDIFSQTDH